MGYEHSRYARRIDADAIKFMSPSNASSFAIDRVSASDSRLYNAAQLTKYFFKIHSGGLVSMDASTSKVELTDGGNAVITAANNFDIFLTTSGTGRVKFGTHAGTGDVVCNGNISIKDAAGNARKLMTTA